ncbi:DUF4402 domain-containing protein [Chitinophaga silvatica]|uniref:DUF4402 domain-containing protein n=1 Tax=Chitinophaga silvatica TaxID=2282649 RepID=A0A3E1Y4U5_9BACT|nr:DUF4402 domain-containing protein [Chitinophaga silvatica]RFS19487.1 DUF4402 domain-containing protein [Chitinophaga silvatica]
MKRFNISLALTAILATISMTSFGQTSSATANVSATIIAPLTITKTVDMNFGNVSVSASTGGTVVLTALGVRTSTGGVSLPITTPGTVTAAAFTVSGSGSLTYSITLPSSATTIANGANSMTVNTFTSLPSGTGLLALGTQTLNVGATLNVSAAQATGTYTSATPFTVTVSYN